METNFILLSLTEKGFAYLNRFLPNYPKKALNLKTHIENCEYSLMENIFSYNFNKNNRQKERYLYDYLIKLSMFDYYMRTSYHKKYISSHQLECISRIVIECRKVCYGLIKSLETK